MSPESKVGAGGSVAWRLFVAIALPEELRRSLAETQRELQSAHGGEGIRWVSPAQMHLTLRFLGDVPSPALGELRAALSSAVGGVGEFELNLTGFGCFPHLNRPRVLWVGVHGEREALRKLHGRVAEATARWGRPGEREFHPHLTLARIKAGVRLDRRLRERLAKSDRRRSFGSWRVPAVQLMRSELAAEGPDYSTLATYPCRTKVPSA